MLVASLLTLTLSGGASGAPESPPTRSGGSSSATEKTTSQERFSGLFVGAIVYHEAEAELEATIELGLDGEGNVAGTIDMEAFDLLYHPLGDFRIDGDDIYFAYRNFSETRGANALFEFDGRIEEKNGQRALVGDFIEQRGRIPFRFERIGDPGSERPARPERPLADLSPAGDELKAAFNAEADKTRLIALISPTCGVCLSSARLLQRHLMEQVDDEDLRVFVVWGPMLGGEERSDAVAATSYLHDERSRHFWTDSHVLAERYSPQVGLAVEEKAWDTFLLYGPQARWAETPPKPAVVMHVGKPLPEEQRLNAITMREHVREFLGDSAAASGR